MSRCHAYSLRAFICFMTSLSRFLFFFFFNDTATTEIYTLSLHDALPISVRKPRCNTRWSRPRPSTTFFPCACRSEEHTSELQSHSDLVCRLLLEKKKNTRSTNCTS